MPSTSRTPEGDDDGTISYTDYLAHIPAAKELTSVEATPDAETLHDEAPDIEAQKPPPALVTVDRSKLPKISENTRAFALATGLFTLVYGTINGIILLVYAFSAGIMPDDEPVQPRFLPLNPYAYFPTDWTLPTWLETRSTRDDALILAQDHVDTENVSEVELETLLRDHDTPEFTNGAIRHAMNNVAADWNAEALATAEQLIEEAAYSEEDIKYKLHYSLKFTEEQTAFALDNLNADWHAEAVERAENLIALGTDAPDQIRLVLEMDFSDEQVQHAMDTLGLE
ncbi:Ltp family lipoprotein [Corynebacterium sp. L4756]|uniref:Ltp family lipoprotein n=1 Tax=unclassified Corynebacterium TaxID=2624378 RepID=UPI00374CB846